MDPLSDILSLLKVEAILTARMEARGPWAMRFPSYKHIKFGTVLEGTSGSGWAECSLCCLKKGTSIF